MKIAKKAAVAVLCAALLLLGSGVCPYNYIDFSIPIVANADYSPSDSDFAVTIPVSVQLGNTAEIKFSDVNLSNGEHISISLSGASGTGNTLALSGAEGKEISYSIKQNDENGAEITIGEEFFTTTKDSTVSLYFTEPENLPAYSGEYNGTVTFSIKSAPD